MKKTDAVEITVPGDKSISHRSLMFAALGSGRSAIRSILDSDDTRSTAAALRSLEREARHVFRETVTAHDGLQIEVPFKDADADD